MNVPMPQDPNVMVHQTEAFTAMLKQQIESGVLKEIYSFLEGDSGYFVSGDVPEDKLHEALLAWQPYVTFELRRTLPLTRSMEISLNILRKRTTMSVSV